MLRTLNITIVMFVSKSLINYRNDMIENCEIIILFSLSIIEIAIVNECFLDTIYGQFIE